MFPSDMRKRRDWFLPLVGGAEINRIQNKSPPPLIFTSRPYPYELTEAIAVAAVMRDSYDVQYVDDLSVVALIMGGTLRDILQNYPDWPIERMTTDASIVGGAIVGTVYKSYTSWPVEPMTVGAGLTGGVLTKVLVAYTNWPVEPMTSSATITSGTLK